MSCVPACSHAFFDDSFLKIMGPDCNQIFNSKRLCKKILNVNARQCNRHENK